MRGYEDAIKKILQSSKENVTKNSTESGTFFKPRQFLPGLRSISELHNVTGLLAAGALDDLIADGLTLFQSLEALGLNGGEMYEYILSVLAGDKAIAFLRIEPFYRTLIHDWYLHL